MNIDYPIIYEIAHKTYAINEFGMITFFVLVGRERGLVIDCGCASFDAKSLIHHLCPVPYDVVITHAHGEHCNGMGFFDQVWMHPLEMDAASDMDQIFDRMYHNSSIWEGTTKRHYLVPLPDDSIWAYPAQDLGAKNFYDFKNIDFTEFSHFPEFLPLQDGQEFSLDSLRKVKVIHLPGHTPGHCAFLDLEQRILFSGDGCCPNLNIRGTDVETAYRGLLNLNRHRQKFDRIYSAHTASGADTAGFSLPPSIADDCLEACRTLLEGTAAVSEQHFIYYGNVRLRFDPDHVYSNEGQEPRLLH